MTEDRDPDIRTDDPTHYRFLALVKRLAGGIYVEETMYVLGVAKRTAERWLGGKPVPDPVIERMEEAAPLVEDFQRDLHALVGRHREAGLSEHLMRLRMRQYSKTLAETPEKDDG
ncbi:hypothetical protein SAMN06297251_1017 [Fulvimarina manganoxydans]|uniref:Uncharacterized protein n=1 Tax=Fulvimarina manganoxydans TaxID=937218 RepID=A0A1W1Y7U8_9HYPH|nr:hypothetical protein [Fulvimarina manganoxydans]SMC32227.1 hypothetical protein SAMN06297251_1017 [Fulvimarina manganoxydans]